MPESLYEKYDPDRFVPTHCMMMPMPPVKLRREGKEMLIMYERISGKAYSKEELKKIYEKQMAKCYKRMESSRGHIDIIRKEAIETYTRIYENPPTREDKGLLFKVRNHCILKPQKTEEYDLTML